MSHCGKTKSTLRGQFDVTGGAYDLGGLQGQKGPQVQPIIECASILEYLEYLGWGDGNENGDRRRALQII